MEELVKNVIEDVIKWRRDLHQIPEVGQYLPQTSEYVCKQLEAMGISYKKGVGIESAIVATVEGTKQGQGKTIALRADMDANPVKEETNLPFASQNGSMHACGHDAHTANLLGTIKVLNEMKDEFSGKIVFLFQPAEEISAGAKPMIDAGCLEDVESIIGMHVGSFASGAAPGTASFSRGSMMACLDKWTMTVHGLGAHGAMPHIGHDPVVMAGHIITSVQEIISRELNPVDPGVVTIGVVNAGAAYNVIPGSVYLEGTARAVNHDTREFIAKRIGEIGESVAKTFRGSVDYNYVFGAPPLVNNEEFTLKIMESAKKAIGEENVNFIDNPIMVGEDFSYYLEKVPGTFIFFTNPLAIDGVCYPHHNGKFAIDEQYFNRTISIFVQAALDLLNN